MTERVYKGKNCVDFPDKYVSIDVETTDLIPEFGKIIEVSAISVQNETVVDRYESLVNPFANEVFIPTDIEKLTGITEEMISNAPKLDVVMPQFHDFIGNNIVIGFNVNFDINFIYDSLLSLNRKFENDFIDVMRISRKLFPEMKHHRLKDMKEKLNVISQHSHRAGADAQATLECFQRMKDIVSNSCGIPAFIDSFKRTSERHINYKEILKNITPINNEIDDTNPLFEKTVVFTGALSSMERKNAFQIVANLGGTPANSLTQKTNFLVVGNEEFSTSVKNGETNKMKKAKQYKEKGLDIEVISENAFLDIVSTYL